MVNRCVELEQVNRALHDVTRRGAESHTPRYTLLMKKGDVLFGAKGVQKSEQLRPSSILLGPRYDARPKTVAMISWFFRLHQLKPLLLDEAIRVSVGSLSPTANWKDLEPSNSTCRL